MRLANIVGEIPFPFWKWAFGGTPHSLRSIFSFHSATAIWAQSALQARLSSPWRRAKRHLLCRQRHSSKNPRDQ